MLATRIFSLSLLALLLAAPAQAQMLDIDTDDCRETWPDDQAKQDRCIAEKEVRRQARRYLEMYRRDPPLQCADYRHEATGMIFSCSPMNIADPPSAERKEPK